MPSHYHSDSYGLSSSGGYRWDQPTLCLPVRSLIVFSLTPHIALLHIQSFLHLTTFLSLFSSWPLFLATPVSLPSHFSHTIYSVYFSSLLTILFYHSLSILSVVGVRMLGCVWFLVWTVDDQPDLSVCTSHSGWSVIGWLPVEIWEKFICINCGVRFVLS